MKSKCVEELVDGIINDDKWVMKMFNEVEINEYEDDEFLSVFLKSFEEPCSERSKVRTITKVRWDIVPKFSSFWEKLSIYVCLF